MLVGAMLTLVSSHPRGLFTRFSGTAFSCGISLPENKIHPEQLLCTGPHSVCRVLRLGEWKQAY